MFKLQKLINHFILNKFICVSSLVKFSSIFSLHFKKVFLNKNMTLCFPALVVLLFWVLRFYHRVSVIHRLSPSYTSRPLSRYWTNTCASRADEVCSQSLFSPVPMCVSPFITFSLSPLYWSIIDIFQSWRCPEKHLD